MSYIALYRKWRPQGFESVVEQEHVVKTLRHSVATGRIAHAYLFCGTRGTGKTTMAHILSRAINCLRPNHGNPCNQCEICREILSGSSMDVLEIDAASNNSVDNVREIRDEVIYAPSRAKYKVYIIDEVHMLSTGAFNALLKTLEEPPAHVVFILATTEPHKLPATILSRCQRFDFRRITIDSIVGRLKEITAANHVHLHEDAARLVAKMADGAMRDAISLLDQCISLGRSEIAYQDVLAVIGIVNDTFTVSLVDDLINKDVSGLLGKVETLVMDGKDIAHFTSDLVIYYRNLLVCKVTADPREIIDVPDDVLESMKRQSGSCSRNELIHAVKELSALESSLKWATNPRIMLEVSLVKLCESAAGQVDGSILERLAALENKINSGSFPPQAFPGGGGGGSGSSGSNSGMIGSGGFRSASAGSSEDKPSAKPSDGAKPAGMPRNTVPKGKFIDNWSQVIHHLKSFGRIKLCAYLFDTKAVSLEDNVVGIVFNASSRANKVVISKAENLEIIQDAAAKVLGHEVRLKCLDEDSLENSSAPAPAEEKDDFVEKARSLAERAGVPFEVIDE